MMSISHRRLNLPSSVSTAAGEIDYHQLKDSERSQRTVWSFFSSLLFSSHLFSSLLFSFFLFSSLLISSPLLSSPLLSSPRCVWKQRMPVGEGRGQTHSYLPLLSWLHLSYFPLFICSLRSCSPSLSTANCTLDLCFSFVCKNISLCISFEHRTNDGELSVWIWLNANTAASQSCLQAEQAGAFGVHLWQRCWLSIM